MEADIQLGRHEQVIPELWDLTERHPLRERFHAQLMLALARCGRQAEALTTYQNARRALAEELGIEPGPELRRLQERVLAGDVELVAPPRAESAVRPVGVPMVPQQLPAAVRHFTGRVGELKVLSGLLTQSPDNGGAVVISAIDGTAGIGKTTLALHWAHQNIDRFPDGQLYANLRGFDPSGSPVEVATVALEFLDALGVPPARVPLNLDAQLALYRGRLAGRRVLIVLDNARDVEQVRPLLPGASGCLVLVTSRNQLGGLVAVDGAVPLTLDLLTHDEARDLMIRRLGRERVARDEAVVDELIELCARLPLALNIAAAHASLHPDQPLGVLADELRDARRRLDALAIGGPAADVRAVFSWSYDTLSPEVARVFRLLGLHSGPDVSVPAVASLTALDLARVRRVLDELTRAHLLTEHAPGRYAFHDLLRVYAMERAGVDGTEAERRDALRRVLDHYLHTAYQASRLTRPVRLMPEPWQPAPGVVSEHLVAKEQAVAWYEAEHAVLLAVIRLAEQTGCHAHAWRISGVTVGFLAIHGHWREWLAACELALAAARRADDPVGLEHAHHWLGQAFAARGLHREASDHLRQALALSDDPVHQGGYHLTLAQVSSGQGQLTTALAHARHALSMFQVGDERPAQGMALNFVGSLEGQLGDYAQALDHCRQALELAREAGNVMDEAGVLDTIGYIHHRLGHHAEAIAHYRRVLDLMGPLGNAYNRTEVLTHLGDAHHAVGDLDAARDAWQLALDILDDLDHPDADAVRAKLADITSADGRPGP
jgi:tetratricopeptide (TPR) repeat protein